MAPRAGVRGQASVLSIGGLDPSGGAGILADVAHIREAGAWGMAVCTLWTRQSMHRVESVTVRKPADVARELATLFSDHPPRVVKTGALGNGPMVRMLARMAREHRRTAWIIDPVRIGTRGPGAEGLGASITRHDWNGLLASAALVTPNLDELAFLVGEPINPDDVVDAARSLIATGARHVLVKGGHSQGAKAVDWLVSSHKAIPISSSRFAGVDVHGSGCALSSWIAAALAKEKHMGFPAMVRACTLAKRRMHRALSRGAT